MTYTKLIIGGAQIGLNYGVSNTKGQLNSNEIDRISLLAKKNNITYIDTASVYGNSEKVIGKYLNAEWKIITKLPHIPLENNQDSIFQNIKFSFFNSLPMFLCTVRVEHFKYVANLVIVIFSLLSCNITIASYISESDSFFRPTI